MLFVCCDLSVLLKTKLEQCCIVCILKAKNIFQPSCECLALSCKYSVLLIFPSLFLSILPIASLSYGDNNICQLIEICNIHVGGNEHSRWKWAIIVWDSVLQSYLFFANIGPTIDLVEIQLSILVRVEAFKQTLSRGSKFYLKFIWEIIEAYLIDPCFRKTW